MQRIQDPVHGLMEFRGMEATVIDLLRTAELQRLRKIRQLGLVHLVFPGAEHSRLVHSLGAAYLAIRFGRRIEEVAGQTLVPGLSPGEESIRDLAVAALCHDLGHGPLSHAWEQQIVGENFDRELWQSTLGVPNDGALAQDAKWHEMVGHALLAWEEGQLHRLLEQQEKGSSTRIRHMLGGKYFLPYLPRLLSSDIDVDRADFIRRDTRLTGVAYGRYDLNWLVSTATIGELQYPSGSDLVFGFDGRKAIRVVEQFLMARRALYETVYQHKTVRCAEGMVALLLGRLKTIVQAGAVLQVASFVDPIVRMIRGDAVPPQDLLSLDDFSLSVLIDAVANDDKMDQTARDLARRIVSRDLFKMVPVPTAKLNTFLRRADAYSELHQKIKPYVSGDPQSYLIVDTARFTLLSPDRKQAVYLIEDGKATAAHDHPILRAHADATTETVRIYTVREAVGAVTKLIQGA
ncbi:MAG TPA: HD domain-containing protein [Longimicrobium sp.]|uniref:HD domain-containing protein n=1 Tax=Longimicrobium sp. TaxID=2029185 RepID=UPI002ED7BDF3